MAGMMKPFNMRERVLACNAVHDAGSVALQWI